MTLPFAHADQLEGLKRLLDTATPFFVDVRTLWKTFRDLNDAIEAKPPNLEAAGKASMELSTCLAKLEEVSPSIKTVMDFIAVGCAWAVPGVFCKIATNVNKLLLKGGDK